MAVQTARRIQVLRGRAYIISRQMRAPARQVNQGHGALNGRGRSGRVWRRTSTPIHTVTNASRVPIDTNSPRIPTGNKPPTIAAQVAVTTVPVEGVRNL